MIKNKKKDILDPENITDSRQAFLELNVGLLALCSPW